MSKIIDNSGIYDSWMVEIMDADRNLVERVSVVCGTAEEAGKLAIKTANKGNRNLPFIKSITHCGGINIIAIESLK